MKSTTRKRAMIAVGVVALMARGAWAADEPGYDASLYAGLKSCKICHHKEEDGDQHGVWSKGPHAKAYELLGSDEAKAAAAKLGIADPQKSGKCLKCHSTAYNFTESVQTDKIEPTEGVVCESCHGPGKNYKKKSTMESREKSIAAGLIYPATKSCVHCHNEQSPTWKADRYTTADGTKTGFDVKQAYEKIKHPRPKGGE